MVVSIQIMVFRVVTMCSTVGRHQHFQGKFSFPLKINVTAVNMQSGCKEGARSDPQHVERRWSQYKPIERLSRKFKKQGLFFFSQFHAPSAT
jgi:hypothetical protein